MAFLSLIRKIVGDPITKEWTDRIKDNLDDLDQRINQAETTGGSVFILNSAVHLANFDELNPDIFYYKATQDFSITEFRGQLFTKQGISIGTLSFDLQKSTDTSSANFNSILSGSMNFLFGSDADYSEKNANLNNSLTTFAAGEVLRVVVTSKPTGFIGKVMLTIGAE